MPCPHKVSNCVSWGIGKVESENNVKKSGKKFIVDPFHSF